MLQRLSLVLGLSRTLGARATLFVLARRFARRFGNTVDPIDDVVLQLTGVLFGDDSTADGDAGLVHGVRVAGDQGVPPVEVAARMHETVATGGRQPADLVDVVGAQGNAIVDEDMA